MMQRIRMKRTRLLIGFITALLLAAFGGLTISAEMANAQSLQIVSNGQANAVVVVTENADAQTTKGANVLVEYVKKSTNVELNIITEDQFTIESGIIPIFIGESAFQKDPSLSTKLEDIKQDGFIIRSYADSIALAGKDSWGTLFAVNEFLERYVGVRWLMPGENGEDVPAHADLNVPLEEIVREPAFKDRMISPILPGANIRFPVQVEWAERNNTHYSITFSHALFTYFPASLYGTTHPEYYPKRNGVPYIPPASATTGWQPCFSVPGTVDAAVQGILSYFSKNPNATTASLGVNDGGGYCEEDVTNPNKSVSDIYYDWVNQVVTKVLLTYPDKRFGLLAYGPIENPPTFELHPSVTPFITKDRMAWSDPETAEADQAMVEAWGHVAANIGWYDYTYGSSYALPRVYPHLMAQYYQMATDNHVSSLYNELYPNWGEGPKGWVMSKLMWDPTQDVDALLDEWYERAAGAAAAADLKAYYDHWEKFWMERVQGTQWFQASKHRINLEFANSAYLGIVTEEEVEMSRQLLESALSKAVTDRQKARVTVLLREFEQYEAAALSYPKEESAPADSAQALAALQRISDTLDTKLDWAVKRKAILAGLQADPILMLPFAPPTWSGWNSYDFWQLIDYLKQQEPTSGPVRDKVRELAEGSVSPNIRQFAKMLQYVSGTPSSLVSNSSFEEGNAQPTDWLLWNESTGTLTRVEENAHSGEASLRINDIQRGGPAQIFPVHSGLLASKVFYYTPPGTSGAGSVQLAFNMMDANKTTLYSLRSDQKTIAETAGQWASINYLEEVPATYQGKEIKFVQVVVIIDKIPRETWLYLDDIGVYQYELQGDGGLASLSVNGTLLPSFDPELTTYAVEVDNEITAIDIMARASDSAALMMVYGKPLNGGTPRTFNLKDGGNTIPILVVAPNGAMTTYKIEIIRK